MAAGLARPSATTPQLHRNFRNYTDIDASDIDFVQLPNGSTFIVYCTGNQQYGYAYNAAAIVDAPVDVWLQSFFSKTDDAFASPQRRLGADAPAEDAGRR